MEATAASGLAAVTVRIDDDVDPAAVAFAGRGAGDRWFCLSEPESGFELAGYGSAAEVISRGEDRFDDVRRRCAAIGARIAPAGSDGGTGSVRGTGPVWVGGFAFSPDGGASPQWASFPPALMWLPEISLVRVDGSTWMTACAADEGLAERLLERTADHLGARLPLADPAPLGKTEVISAQPPAAYEEAVAGARERIANGDADKLVLAREVRVEAPSAHRPAELFGLLREAFPSCFDFCVGTSEAAFMGASPELLIRRSGQTAATVALAGSTRRSADPAVDAHLASRLFSSGKNRAEHAFVVNRIKRELGRVSVWVDAESEPGIARIANIQHLATPIKAQLADSRSAVELAGLLHPTPAVGAEPRSAVELIPGLEHLDRGWYAGAVGWMDGAEDGEFCVGLRSALLRDRTAHLYAGNGIVADSDPAAELAETEVKLEALLPLLSS